MQPTPNTLQALREARALSRQDLADKAGVHYVTVLRLETEGDGLASATVETLSKLARVLGVPTAALLPVG